MKKSLLGIAFASFALLSPLLASAQAGSFSSQGIFSCSGGGSAQGIGSQSPAGGSFVPVADYTVEKNTGILVYKECILREIVDKERMSATAQLAGAELRLANNGRNGSPYYVQKPTGEKLNLSDKVYLSLLQDSTLSTLNPALRDQVKRSLAQSYMTRTRNWNTAYGCSYQGDLSTVLKGTVNASNIWNALIAEGDPGCDPLFAFYSAEDQTNAIVARELQNQQDIWNWGDGFYAVQDQYPINIYTPSYLVAQNTVTAEQSGFYQLQNANDVGQMVGALFAGMSTQIESPSGLAGLSSGTGGQQSYLDQVAAASQQDLRNAASNAALQILTTARQIEAAYNAAITSVAQLLSQAIGQLRGAEKQCWVLVIQKVCTTPLSAQNTCTDAAGATLHVATSTQFSQDVINSQIAPLATTTVANLRASNQALSTIDQLIQQVSNTSDPTTQQQAIQQVDSMVANHQLHSQNDVATAQNQESDVQTAMQNLLQSAAQAWGDSTDPSVGWCNINNPTVIQQWDQKWQ